VRSSLLLRCDPLTVWSKKLVFPQHRDWLVELLVGHLRCAAIVEERARRLQCMEEGMQKYGPRASLRLELFDLVADFAQALRAQDAWHLTEALRETHAFDICTETLKRLQTAAETAWWPPTVRDLPPALKRRMGDWHANEGVCGTCGAVASVETLTACWRQAPAGAESQLEVAFGCGHRNSKPAALQCLNVKCRSRNPLGPGMRTVRLGSDESMTRCARCQYPLCFGRTVFSLNDILRPSQHREYGREARRPVASFLSHAEGFETEEKRDGTAEQVHPQHT
jgi:hypothetical protein